jgi:4-hydroxy-3-methylbut-2-enyl diphosphate reductase
MKISIAKTAGFCMGVRRAVEMVLDAPVKHHGPIYTYGPLIHNPQVLNLLAEKGITVLNDIPDEGAGTILIRAHGVPPQDKKKLTAAGFDVIDATCPRVIKVQTIIRKYAGKGYTTIIVGDKNHPEVVGLLGFAGGKGHVAGTWEDVQSLPVFDTAIVVAQTTQNSHFFEKVKSWAGEKYPHYLIFNTICDSTSKRQAEVKHLAESVDGVLVVGGFNSGNTKRLFEIAKKYCDRAYHIETEQDIDFAELPRLKEIGITAGASTPNWIINKIFRTLEASRFKKGRAWRKVFFTIRRTLLLTNIYVSLGAGFLCYACTKLQGITNYLPHVIISILYVQSMHILNHLTGSKADRYNDPERSQFYRNHKVLLSLLAFIAGAAGLLTAYSIGPLPFIILLVMSILGLSYNIRLMPKGLKKVKYERIRDIPSSKTILIAMAWGIVSALFPQLSDDNRFTPASLFIFIWSVGVVFVRTAFFDILDMQGDRIVGRETIPLIIGEKKTRIILKSIIGFLLLLLLVLSYTHMITGLGYMLMLCHVYLFFVILFFERGKAIPGTTLEFLIESQFILAGLLTFVWAVITGQ